MDEGNPLKMKVTELKSELGKRGLSQTGLKFDLAQRLQSAMDVDEFGALPSLASPAQPPPCVAPSPLSNPNGRPSASVDSCDDPAGSLLPAAAAVQAATAQDSSTTGLFVPQPSTAESTCSANCRAKGILATDGQTNGLGTRAAPKIHEGQPSKKPKHLEQSISVMWGGDTGSKDLPRSVAKEKRVVTITSSVTPTKPGEEPIGTECTMDGAEEGKETQKAHSSGSAEQAEQASAESEELCAQGVYQLETDTSRGADSERTTSYPTENRVEESVAANLIERAEVPVLPCSAGRGRQVTIQRKPRTNVGGPGEIDKTVVGRSEKQQQSDDDERGDTAGGRTVEQTDGSSDFASEDGCTDLAHVTPPSFIPVESLFVLPFREIDKMKDREQRFGQPSKTDHPDCSEPICSGRSSGDVHDEGRAAGGSRREEGPRSGATHLDVPTHLEVVGTIITDDTWKEKLEKRKARFETPPLDRSRRKNTSEAIREASSPVASDAAAKMARRIERFQAFSDGPRASLVAAPAGTPDPRGGSFASSESVDGTCLMAAPAGTRDPRGGSFASSETVEGACLVTAPAGTPDPRGDFFASSESVEEVAAPQAAAAAGDVDAPLPQRRKRRRDRLSSLATILAPAKQVKTSPLGPTSAPAKWRRENAAGTTLAAAKRARSSSPGTTISPRKQRGENAAGAGKGSDEDRGGLVSTLVKPSFVAGGDRGSPEARGTTKMKKPLKQRVRFLAVVSTSDGSSFVQGGCSRSPPPRRRAATFLASPPPPPPPLPSPAFPLSSTSSRVPLCIERDGVTLERLGVAPRPIPTKYRNHSPENVGKGSMEKKKHSKAPAKYAGEVGVAPGASNHRKSPPKFVGKIGVVLGATTTKRGKTPPAYVGQGSVEEKKKKKKKPFKTSPKFVGTDSMEKKPADQASKMRDRQKRFTQESGSPGKSTACW